MLGFIARRILVAIPLLLVVSLVCFALTYLLPDPAITKLGQHATAPNIEAFHHANGLDDPFLVRYGRFLSEATGIHVDASGPSVSFSAPFQFGKDIVKDDGSTIGDAIRERFPKTFELALVALTVATFLGLLAGSLGAAFPRRFVDWIAQVFAVVGSSVPIFWLGFMASLYFAVELQWLPHPDWKLRVLAPGKEGREYATNFYLLESLFGGHLSAFGRALRHIALPGLVLSTIPLAVVTRMTRSTMLEELGRDYIRTARAKGVVETKVVSRHAMRNALIPIVTVTGLQAGALLGGAVLTETVFAWPGLGRYVADGVRAGNGPLVVAGVFTFAATFVVVNLIVDILYHAIDPRLRRSGSR